MNLSQLEQSDLIIYKCISGSHCYGTNNADSDVDLRGVFCFPNSKYLSLLEPIPQISDNTNDTIYYSLKRFFNLLTEANPNMIELLFMPDDCIQICKKKMLKLIENRHLFITKKAYHSHSGYAYAQVKKAKGQNKWINNPQLETAPNRLDYCWVIPMDSYLFKDDENETSFIVGQKRDSYPIKHPFRPIPLKEAGYFGDLTRFNISGQERISNIYRMYYYGDSAKGVFRGPFQQLVVESIPLDDEWPRFRGFLIYDIHSYEKDQNDWKNYWTWRKERNEARYVLQEKGEVDFDCKNLLHSVRLLWSGKNILLNRKPIVRFEGEQLKYLRDIRLGKYSYEDLMTLMEDEMQQLYILKDSSDIPNEIDFNKVENLYRELIEMEN